MIDLHTHTDASDGRCSPADLVERAKTAGVRVLAVTDHDTVASCDAAWAACRAAGIEFVCGIEISAVREEVDVHVLGYFIDPRSSSLNTFLAAQRQQRVDRVRGMIAKLAALGVRLDAEAILRPSMSVPGASVGRPAIARALVAGGFVVDTNDAFSRWLARGRPAFVPREGAAPEHAIAQIHAAGGVASLAHPGLVERDDWIPALVDANLDAIEAYHIDHDEAATAHYREVATRYDLALSGGTDYHGDLAHGAPAPGAVSLPQTDFDQLRRRAASRASASGPRVSS